MDVITTHLNADFDALASMIAARKLYPDAVMAFSGSQEKNLREFLSHSVHTYDLQRPKNVAIEKITRLIVVDTRQPSRIGKFRECLKNPGLEVHLYDHHPDAPGDIVGDYEDVRPVGSTVTVFTQIFRKKGIAVNKDDATLFAMALYEDTGSFIFDSTTPDDLQAMAWLLERGADLNTVSQFISQELTSSQVQLLNDLLEAATTYTIQAIEIVVAKITLPQYVDDFAIIVRRMMTMENLDCLFALARMGDRTYLICRSRIPEVNVGEIAIEFGGGGHASAASATVRDMTLIEAEEKLIHLLHKYVRTTSMAGQLMSAPVIYGKPDITIRMAGQILDRYNITVIPIIDDDEKVLGIISRNIVSRSIYHGLGDLPVTDFMTSDFVSLPSSASLAEIQELIIEHRQRFIPVIDHGKLKGVITRTDLLNLLVTDPAHLPKNLLDPEERPSVERNRNLNSVMLETLSRKFIVLLRAIGEVGEIAGYRAFAVGGFVRDLLMRKKNLDLDVVVEGDGIDFAKRLARHLKGEVRTHEKFNTAVVILPDGFKIDVATARLEYYEYPAAMPSVELSSIKLDLYRRDFTINAMAIHLNPNNFGTLVDFFNCQNDLKDRKIRILHNLSFVEDPTRIFRAIRFEQRLGFRIGKHTEKLIKNAVRMNLFNCLPGAGRRKKKAKCNRFGFRFFGELQLILAEETPLAAIKRMAGFDLLRFLHPKLVLDPRLEEILEETEQAVSWHQLLFQDESCNQWIIYLLALTSRITTREFQIFCNRYEIIPRYRDLLVSEKHNINRLAKIFKKRQRSSKSSELYFLLKNLSTEGLLALMGFVKKQGTKKAISQYVTYLRHEKTLISGKDLKKMGYKPGPLFRTILDSLLTARLDNEVKTKADEIKYVKKKFPKEESLDVQN